MAAGGPGADRRPAHGAPDDSKAIPLPELERLWSRRDLPLRDRPLWRLPCDSAAWRQDVRRVAPKRRGAQGHYLSLLILVLKAVGLAAAGPRCQVVYEPGATPASEGWIFTGGGCRLPDSEQITSALNVVKSMVAGLDTGRLHRYSFSRSPERQMGLAEMDCRAAAKSGSSAPVMASAADARAGKSGSEVLSQSQRRTGDGTACRRAALSQAAVQYAVPLGK